MISKDEQMRAAVAEQAVDWFLERDERPLDTRESAALVAWYKASPINVEEFLGVAAIARDLREAGPDPEHSVEALVARARADDDSRVQPLRPKAFATVSDLRVRRWQTAAAMFAALGLASLGLFWLWNLRSIPQQASPAGATALHFATSHGEQQTHRLTDGSVLHLNTDTAVMVQYSKTERQVLLTSGQAGFEVAHAPARPFRVVAGALEVIARGTRFDVRLSDDSTTVTVAEGRVAIEPAPAEGSRGAPTFIELGPNQQLTASRGEWPAVPVAVDAERSTSWLHRQIAFNHEPLERVAAEFNRYAPKPIEITTPELRNLQISGVFATDDLAAFIAFLRSLDGVRVDETPTGLVVSKK